MIKNDTWFFFFFEDDKINDRKNDKRNANQNDKKKWKIYFKDFQCVAGSVNTRAL